MSGAQLSVNPVRAITWFVGVTIYGTFFKNNLHLASFYAIKYFWKKISYSKGDSHWTNFWIERNWAPWPYICIPFTDCFHDKIVISKENIRLDCYLLLKYCRRQCTLLPLPGPNHAQKLIQKRNNKVVALGNPSKPSGCSNHVLKQKLKREHHVTGALRNQSNKHQNSQKPMLKAEQKIYQLHA